LRGAILFFSISKQLLFASAQTDLRSLMGATIYLDEPQVNFDSILSKNLQKSSAKQNNSEVSLNEMKNFVFCDHSEFFMASLAFNLCVAPERTNVLLRGEKCCNVTTNTKSAL
jgi:hypothetical protein